MACNDSPINGVAGDSLVDTLERNLGRQCAVFTDSGDCFSGILSDVDSDTCTLITADNNRCPIAHRVKTIPINKISCLSTSQF